MNRHNVILSLLPKCCKNYFFQSFLLRFLKDVKGRRKSKLEFNLDGFPSTDGKVAPLYYGGCLGAMNSNRVTTSCEKVEVYKCRNNTFISLEIYLFYQHITIEVVDEPIKVLNSSPTILQDNRYGNI